jgi:hypothetical protein
LSPLRLPISPPGQDCEERDYDIFLATLKSLFYVFSSQFYLWT